MFARVAFAFLIGAFLIGCSSGSGVVGNYTAEMLDASKNDPISKGFVESTSLELKADKKFSLKMMGMPIEGTYQASGNSVTLTPTHFQGMTVAEAMKKSSGGTKDLDKPLTLNVSEDGKTLTISNSSSGPVDFKFVKKE